MSSFWNYRVIRLVSTKYPDDHLLEVHEVYYRNKKPISYCAATVCGNDLAELAQAREQIGRALTLPILRVTDDGPITDDVPQVEKAK